MSQMFKQIMTHDLSIFHNLTNSTCSILLQRSMYTCYICSPVRPMNRTVRRRSVAVPWSLFPRDLSVGQVLSLSLLWIGHDCRTWLVVCASSPKGQRPDFSIAIMFYEIECNNVRDERTQTTGNIQQLFK